MSTKEALHQLVEEDLRDAGDPDEEPFSDETLASLDRGLKDAAEGRLKSLEQYDSERRMIYGISGF